MGPASARLSSTRRLYLHPWGRLNEIDGTLASMASMTAVMVRWVATVAGITDGDFARFPRLRWQHPLGPA